MKRRDDLRTERGVLCALIASTALVFWREADEVFSTPKFSVLVWVGMALVCAVVVRAYRMRAIDVPRHRTVIAAGVFALTLLLPLFTARAPMVSLLGRTGRSIGVVLYLVCVLAFVVAVRSHLGARPTALRRSIVVTAGIVSAYGVLQAIGLDPWEWGSTEGKDVFSTLANANFVGGWLAITAPFSVWTGRRDAESSWRVAGITIAVASAFVALASGSVQGPIAMAVGVGVLAVVVASEGGVRAALRRRTTQAGAAAAVVLLVAVLVGPGPLAEMRQDVGKSFEGRVPRWSAAVELTMERPATGYGFGAFPDRYRAVRDRDFAFSVRSERNTDSPHSVPLELFASGGLAVGLSYLAFVGLVGVTFVRGLRRAAGEERFALGALGGAWIAYQVQSVVSIDEIALPVLHWIIAGVLVATAAQPEVWRWPAAAVEPQKGSRRRAEPRRSLTPVAVPLTIASLVVLWLSLVPLRASLAAQHGDELASLSRRRDALAEYEKARDLGWWDHTRAAQVGEHLIDMKQVDDAIAAFDEALRRNPYEFASTMTRARLAGRLEADDTLEWYRRALRLDPWATPAITEAATYAADHGEGAWGLELIESVIDHADGRRRWPLYLALGKVRAELGDEEGAIEAFEAIPERAEEHEAAQEELAELR